MTPELAKSFGLKEERGALVAQVFKETPAEQAGIEQGDVIVEFDGKQINSSRDLPQIVASTPAGKNVSIKIVRNGKTITKEIKIAEMQEKTTGVVEAPTGKKLGIAVQDITPELARELGLKDSKGVVVAQVEQGGAAADAGMRKGDVIREVNRKPVADVQGFMKEVGQAKDGGSTLLLVQRGENKMFVAVTPK